LTRIPLTQQWIAKLAEALEQLMKIKSMEGYPRNMRMTRPLVDENLSQLQGQISTRMENIQQ
jgi:hypothetical protein